MENANNLKEGIALWKATNNTGIAMLYSIQRRVEKRKEERREEGEEEEKSREEKIREDKRKEEKKLVCFWLLIVMHYISFRSLGLRTQYLRRVQSRS